MKSIGASPRAAAGLNDRLYRLFLLASAISPIAKKYGRQGDKIEAQ
jgi:hypothetical protein